MEENNIVHLKDEAGKNIKFERIMTFDFAESLYVAITPVEDLGDIKNGDVMLLEIREDKDGLDCYLPIENEQKLNRVFEEFERLYYE